MAANRTSGSEANNDWEWACAAAGVCTAVDRWLECRRVFVAALARELGWEPARGSSFPHATSFLRQAATATDPRSDGPRWKGARSAGLAWLDANDSLAGWIALLGRDGSVANDLSRRLGEELDTCKGHPHRVLDLAARVERSANAVRMAAVESIAAQLAMAKEAEDPVARDLAGTLDVTEGNVVAALFKANVLSAEALHRSVETSCGTRPKAALAQLQRAGIVEHPIDERIGVQRSHWRLTDLGRRVAAACRYTR